MNYISLIDQLGIDIDTITNLDSAKIIRLQKQLKANAVLNNTSNLGELSALIENLKTESVRNNHIFVEKHPWLKQIISGNYANVPQNVIKINTELIDDEESLKYFLAPYFKSHLKPFLSEALNKEKYLLLINFVESTVLFSEEIEQIIINFFISKLNFAKVYIEEGKLDTKASTVSYIYNRNFVKCLSQYPHSFEDEINELNSEIIDIYNEHRKQPDHPLLVFAAKTMVAFGEVEVSNYMLKDVLKSNAEIAKPYAFNTPNTKRKSKSNSGSGMSTWSIIIVIFFVLRIGYRLFKSNSNDRNSYNFEQVDYKNSKYNEDILRALEEIKKQRQEEQNNKAIIDTTTTTSAEISTTETIKKSNKVTLPEGFARNKVSNHIRFLYTLKLKTDKENEHLRDNTSIEIEDFTNAYPRTFNLLQSSDNDENKNYSLVKNQTKKDLVVFKLTDGIDESIYIPKDKSRFLRIKNGDSLMFYYGDEFTITKFSSFKKEATITNLYEINNLNTFKSKEIRVLPSTISTFKKSKLNSDKIVIDTAYNDNIKVSKLELKKLNFDRIYANWYRDYYNSRH